MNVNVRGLVSIIISTDCIIYNDNLEDEHGKLRGQIEQLKTSLEHAQMERRRKIEYDTVTEKVNTLPSREELEKYASFINVEDNSTLSYLPGQYRTWKTT